MKLNLSSLIPVKSAFRKTLHTLATRISNPRSGGLQVGATTTFLLICFVFTMAHHSRAGSSGAAVDAGFPPTPGNTVFHQQAHLFPAYSNVNLANTTGVGSMWFPVPAALKGNRWFEANFLFEYAGNPDPLGMSFHYGPRVDGDYRGGASNGQQNGTPYWNEGLTVTIEAQDSPGHPEGVEVWYGQTQIGFAPVIYSRNYTYPIEIRVFEEIGSGPTIYVIFNNQLICNFQLPSWPSAAQIANSNWEFGFSGQGGYSDGRGTWSGATIFVDSVYVSSASSSTTRGKVQLADGTGIAGAAVSRVHGGAVLETTTSQADGTFVFPTAQSERVYQTITASKTGYNFLAQQNVMDGTDNLVFIPTSMPTPTFNQPSNFVLNEDQSTVVNLTGIGASAGLGYTATFTVTATSSNPSIVPHPTVNYTSANSTGTVNIAPIPNRSGTADITVQAGFAGNPQTVSKTFAVTVNPANDPPFAGDGSALSFNGTSNQEVRIPHNSALNAFPMTVEFWLRTQSNSGVQGLINKYVDASGNGWSIHLSDGRLRIFFYSGGAYLNFDGGFVANGAWRHVAFTVDSTGAKSYIGGTQTASVAWAGSNPSAPTSASDLHLGFYGPGYPSLNGKLREARIWSKARTVYEINATRNTSLAGNEANLAGYWKLNDESGLTAQDSTANNFDGTLLNGPVWNEYSGPLNEDTPKTIYLFGYDEEGAALTYSIVTPPSHGTLSGTGSVRAYLPDPNYHGNDSFTFKVNDGVSDSAIATVLLTIHSVNDPPVAGSNFALRFDGVDDYADINGADLSNQSFSIEFWARNNFPGNQQILMSQGSGALDQGLHIGWRSNNVFTFAFYGDDLDSPAFADTNWHHWACTFDAATREQRIYRDGVQVASRIANGAYQGQGILKLGHYIMGDSFHRVDLDELRIWTGVRTPEQILANRNLSLNGNELDLLTYHRMDEGVNRIIHDFSSLGGSQNGFLFNGPRWIQGNRFGTNYALQFNGIDGHVQIPSVDLSNKSFSIEFWARNNQTGNGQILLSQGQASTDQGLHIGWRSNNAFTFAFYADDLDTPISYADTDWHHWACTFDVATRTQRIYRDGQLAASRTSNANYQGTGILELGHFIMGPNFHNVDLDELRIWTSVRTEQQVLDNQYLSLTGNEPHLIVNAPMDEGVNSIINDFSALEGAQNGTLIDGVQWISSNRTGSTLVSNDVVVPEGGSIGIKMPGFDADGDPLTYNITGPTNGSLVGTGSSRTYTPTSPTFNGTDRITYTITDSQGATSPPTTIAITVSAVNNPPEFVGEPPILNQVVVESTFDNIIDHEIPFSVQDVDDADGSLIVVANSLDTTLVHNANLLILPANPTDGNRILRHRSTPGESGTVRIYLTVIDAAGATDETFFDLRIEPQPAYAVVDIGTLNGRSHSFGRGINENGMVVGMSSQNSLGALRQGSRGFVFHGIENGSLLEDLGVLSGDIGSAAYAINDAGIIVGASLGSSSTRRSFIHDGLSMTELTVNLGGTGSEARDINQEEWITGYGNNASGKPIAFLREANASAVAIPMLSPFDDQSRGLSLNDHGVVVGETSDGSGLKRAFHYDSATTTTTLLSTPAGSLHFDGVPNHHVTVGHDAAFNTVPFTVEFWLQTSVTTGTHGLLGKYVDGSLNGWFFLMTEGKLRVAYYASAGNPSMDYTTSTTLADGDWHHVALTVGSNAFKVYVDGVEDHSETSGSPIVACSTTANLLLGAPIVNYGSLQGSLSEVRIWSSERSASQIDDNKNLALNGNETNLVGYWRLSDGQGSVAYDSTSANHSGTLSFGLDWQWHDTNILPVFANATATAINNQGIVVGTFSLDSARTRGFIASAGATSSIGALPNDIASEAFDVNEFGQTAGVSKGSNLSRATVHTAGTLYDLNALIPSGSGWTLEQANSINDRGEITGTGTFNGNKHAFLALPANVIGKKVVRPQGTVTRFPVIEILDSHGDSTTTSENAFFWSDATKKLYAIRPATARIRWFKNNNPADLSTVDRITVNIWPKDPTIHIAEAPVELLPEAVGRTYMFQTVEYQDQRHVDPITSSAVFNAKATGYAVLYYLKTNGQSPDPSRHEPCFEVVQTMDWNHPDHLKADSAFVGDPLSHPDHFTYTNKSGFVINPNSPYDGAGSRAAYDRGTRTGAIIPVNTDSSSNVSDDLIVVWYPVNRIGVPWASLPVQYSLSWRLDSDDPDYRSIDILDGQGSGPLPPLDFPEAHVYYQHDPNQPGFNPNEEHAMLVGDTVYALQADLNAKIKGYDSISYVLLKYRDIETNQWAMRAYHVVANGPPDFAATVGAAINPPLPISAMPLCGALNYVVKGVEYTIRDYKGVIWAKSAPPQPTATDIQVNYYYPLQESFFFDLNLDGAPDVAPGACMPFNEASSGLPTSVNYSLSWPDDAPQLRPGETVLNAKNGLPEIKDLSRVQVVFDSGGFNSTNPEASQILDSIGRIYDPLSPRVLPFPPGYSLPNSIQMENVAGAETFADLPSVLKLRLTYDRSNNTLIFKGILDESYVGEPLLLPNVLSSHERDRLKLLDDNYANPNPVFGSWDYHMDRLHALTINPNNLPVLPTDGNGVGLAVSSSANKNIIPSVFGEASKALSIFRTDLASLPSGRQFITLLVNNDPDLPGLPVDMKVIEINRNNPFRGDLKVIQPSNVFDERITIRHSSDFGGNTDRLDFEWYYHPGSEAADPPITDPLNGEITDLNGWILHTAGTLNTGSAIPPNGINQITLGDASSGESGLLILSDNRYLARYRGYDLPNRSPEQWGAWVGDPASGATTQGVLVEGWVKRVLRGLNPFDSRTADFHSSAVDTFASMIKQAGIRYEGDIAFNPDADNINNIGLIEAYETVLRRAARLSIDGSPPVDYSAANDALLLVTGRISDLYMLLGNEAYADAADPTIGFGNSSGAYGSLASSIFSFQNQLPSLLDEELTLLRGRDDSSTGVSAPPAYNRLYWNFTMGEGEVAYQQNYNVTDQDFDGFINEMDARVLYPQGHGDAWGHYLTAQKAYYKLLRHPSFTWTPRSESVSVGGVAVEVDFLDERKFAAAAAARAKTGSEIVDLTYRQNYVESPSGQWQGYKDADADRAWGVDEWSRRVTQGAYFDWVTANFILPADDTANEGLAKIDRQTVSELREIPVQADIVRARLDNSNLGLNPLGLAQDVVPFDIDPSQIAAGNTLGNRSHYEQIQERAVIALKNAAAVWDEANKSNSLLRQNQDSADEFRQNANARERDLKNRMIEIFGKPYNGDIGAGKPYPEGYDGPDIYRYMYVDSLGLSNESTALTKTYTAFWNSTELTHADGTKTKGFVFPGDFAKGFHETVTIGALSMKYPTRVSTDNPWPFVAAFEMGQRDTPGEIQIALGDVIQNHRRLKSAQLDYLNLLREIDRQVESLNERKGLRAQEVKIKADLRTATTSLNAVAGATKGAAEIVKAQADSINTLGSITASALPKIVGVAANDVFSVARAQVFASTFVASKAFGISRLALEVASRGAEAALKVVEGESKRQLESIQFDYDIGQKFKELERALDKEALLQVEMVSQEELLRQSIDRYQSWIAKGFRVMEERLAFRKRTAATVQNNRYRDMTFRITRNDALQKYHAQFDLAARYVYLAAKAYDYEVNLLGSDNDSGQKFLTDIVKYRSLGQLVNGAPVPGRPGLADALGRMMQNFSVLKSQLGINNPQKETGRFSLRTELYRIGAGDSAAWQVALNRGVVEDLWQIPEFRRYCRPFAPPPGQAGSEPQPGLVIAFPTEIQFGQNFFGWDLAGGDSAYDPSQFATKIHSVGVWFENYDGAGLSVTPRIYLIPVGMDIMRSPDGDSLATRQWRVLDQVLPEPFPISANQINNPDFIPINDGLGGSFIDIRRFAGLRAYHDGGFNESQMTQDSRLIGRSVWNTQWMLIIPGGTLLNDPDAGLQGFIDSVTDIKLLFRTYSYSGI